MAEEPWDPRPHHGWIGMFTTYEWPGAWRNGTRVVKNEYKPGDIHQEGAPGRILGSIGHTRLGYGYFVEWDDKPRVAVFIAGDRLSVAN